MSRINDILKEKCPDGVEYKSIGSLITRVRTKGKTCKDATQVYVVSNTMGIVRSEDYHNNEVHSEDTSNYTVIKQGMFAYNPARLNIGSLGVLKKKETGLVSPMYVVFSVDENIVLQEYMLLNLKSSFVKNKIESLKEEGARFRFDYERWDKIEIPVPPIEVQQEIVRILDKFTELEAELQAELAARKKQFEYYREWLTSFDDEVNTIEMTLGDIYDFQYGKGNNIPTEGGEYPVYGSNGIAGWHHEYNSEDAPVIGHIGAYAGIVNWASGKHFVTYNGVICKHKNSDVNKRYAYYLLMKQDFLSEQKGAQPFVSYDSLKKPIVKIPPMKEQERLVRMFDIFNIICSDYKNGLPAEIATRHKQYEYYRDKLLTFKRKEV